MTVEIFNIIANLAKEFGVINALLLSATGFYLYTANKNSKVTMSTLQSTIQSQKEDIRIHSNNYRELLKALHELSKNSLEKVSELRMAITNQDNVLHDIKTDYKEIKVSIANINSKISELTGKIVGALNTINALVRNQNGGGKNG